jgi:RNA polymerase sigma-70 factor (ECF subfamily)
LDLKELIKRCLLGDPEAQKLLFETFVAPMARLCMRYLKDHDAAQDAMMEAFMKVFDRLKTFEYQGEHSLEVWIRKITINECLMKLRKNRTRFFLDVVTQQEQIAEVTADNFFAADILMLIDSLPEGCRTVFNLSAIDGYSHKEIAKLFDISESASRSQLTHARSKLKELLLKHGWK